MRNQAEKIFLNFFLFTFNFYGVIMLKEGKKNV